MNLILFGPPGAGKGTQAKYLVNKLNGFQISTGDMLRDEIQKDTEIGKKIINDMNDGRFVNDVIVNKLIKNVIGKDTISAVRSGFFWGYAGLIDNIINLIKKETRKSFKVIITGGFSELFKKSIKTKVNHDKDITINGLVKITKLIK